MLHEAGLIVPDYIGQDGEQRPTRHANEFWDSYGVAVHPGQQQEADLVFFSKTGVFPTHIGIVVDAERYIHAPGFDDTEVEILPIPDEHIEAIDGTGRVLYTRNPIGFKSPARPAEQPTYRLHQALV